jgi:hypothetical protein
MKKTLAILLLAGLTLLTGCGSDSATTKGPVANQSDGPSAPAGDGGDFCKLLYSKAGDLKSGQDVTQMSDELLQKLVATLGNLAAAAPDELKEPLNTMKQIYGDVASGKTKTTDEAEMTKVADASLKYIHWTVEHCKPPSGS